MNTQGRKLARTALLLAVAVLCQSLRLMIPMPAFFSTFLIGTLVNACLLIALRTCGLPSAVFIAAMTPFVAYFQGLLPFPIFIPPVALGNSLYVSLFALLRERVPFWPAALLVASGKAAALYVMFLWMLSWFAVPQAVATGLLFVMGWPQFVTGLLGALLARLLDRRLQAALGDSWVAKD